MNFSKVINENVVFDVIHQCAVALRQETYVVGGFVRDLLLKRSSKDIDIVSVGSGIALAEKVAEALGKKENLVVFKNFGTAMIKEGEYEIEFVGARKESYRSETRKPIVEDGTLEDDQKRRDFTINALAISLNKEDYGELVDPFEGVKDLKRKMIRTPLEPEITFSDDPLRMMRGIRFAAQLSFDISPETFDAITRQKERLEIVSQERITEELNKLILAPTPSYGFKLLYHAGILALIFPEMVALQGTETINGWSHKDNFYHTLQVLDNVAKVSDNLWLRWAAILHDIAKPATKRFDERVGWTFHGHEDKGARMVPQIFRKLKLPLNEKMKYVQKLVRLHLRPIALVKETVSDSAIRRLLFEAGEDVEDLMKLCRADITSKNDTKVKKYLRNFDYVQRKMVTVEGKDKVRNFQPEVGGEEIMKAFDLKPGRMVGLIKEEIKEAVLEGKVKNNYEDLYQYMLALGKKEGLTPVN